LPGRKLPHFQRAVSSRAGFALIRFRLVKSKRQNRASAAIRLRTILENELSRRRRVNSRYSLRAFARSVNLEHSTLSQMLRGKRPMTWQSIQGIAARMRWTGTAVLQVSRAGRVFDSRAVAQSLGISVDEVNLALTDLCLFGLMQLQGE
jgi:transcriptional regulator with XRE-family HTH domain